MDEAQLVRRAQSGDTRAFEVLVIENQDFVYNLALRTIGNPSDAEDIAQDAFIRAWLALPNFRQQARFRTWLYRIVVNLCYNLSPRLRRELIILVDEEDTDLSGVIESPGYLAQLELDEQREWLYRQIDALPDHYRMLISLRYQNELSYDEIARITDLPLGTVKTGLFRAKERLRQAMLEKEEMV